ncbi:hypothetical protein ACIOMQ_37700 [Streptomyces sp. NPDC087845]|uniref:hypothetical protein n=1 Tax=Streptomyces sp. NPDC087845 TaxID=3365806 RepID=UPI00382C97D1
MAVSDFRADELEVTAGTSVHLQWKGPSTLDYTVSHSGNTHPVGKQRTYQATVDRDTTFQLSYVTSETTHYLTTTVTVKNPKLTGLAVEGDVTVTGSLRGRNKTLTVADGLLVQGKLSATADVEVTQKLSVKNVEATEEVKTKNLSATGEVKTKDLSATGKFLVGSTNYCKMQDGDAWFSGQITAKDAATNRLLVGSENFGEMKKDDLWIGGKLTGADNVAKYDERIRITVDLQSHDEVKGNRDLSWTWWDREKMEGVGAKWGRAGKKAEDAISLQRY